MPGAVPRILPSLEQLGSEVVIVGVEAARNTAERNDASAGECGDVHYRRGIEALGVGERIAQDEPALRVRVEDLDRLARHAGDDVARFGGVSARHVLTTRNNAYDVHRQPPLRYRLEGTED